LVCLSGVENEWRSDLEDVPVPSTQPDQNSFVLQSVWQCSRQHGGGSLGITILYQLDSMEETMTAHIADKLVPCLERLEVVF